MADSNSDDCGVSETEQSLPLSTRGQKSIDLIFENAVADRISSKTVVKHLQFSRGDPKLLARQELWVRRFEVFRRVTLRKDLSVPYTGDELIRFFHVIIRESIASSSNSPLS